MSPPRDALTERDITLQAITDFRQVFQSFDRDESSTIDAQEFAQILQLLGDERPSPQKLINLMRAAKTDSDSPDEQDDTPALSFKEFLNFFAIFKQDDATPVPHPFVFQTLDTDHSKQISPLELKKCLAGFGMNLSMDEVSAMTDLAVLSGRPGDNIGPDDFRDLYKRVSDFRKTSTVIDINDEQ